VILFYTPQALLGSEGQNSYEIDAPFRSLSTGFLLVRGTAGGEKVTSANPF